MRTRRAVEAYVTAMTGDLRPSRAWLEVAPRDATERAWRAALLAQRWRADPREGEVATPSQLEALGDADPEALHRAALECGRAAVTVRDGAALARYAALARGGSVLEAWRALAEGEPGRAAELAVTARRALPAERVDAPTHIEAVSVRALALVEQDDLAQARVLARRASRMARTEDLPQSQYLANLALARVRRHEGAPHLALRIADALAAVVPPPWWARVAWEQGLSGRAPRLGHPEARALSELLGAASRGDPGGLDAAARALAEPVTRWPALSSQLHAALAVLDPRSDLRGAPSAVRAFCRGETHAVPGVVSGLCATEDAASSGVCVGVTPSGDARRVAGRAAAVAAAIWGVGHAALKPGRTQLALSVLALAGPDGLGRDAFFRRIYGFAFDHELHDGVFRTLLHRMRKTVDQRGVVEADLSRVSLTLREPILLADPRCEETLEARMLRYLAQSEHRSARDAAKRLGVPLRTAQTALQGLTASGLVEGRRLGRKVEYRVEDTTFSEPTRWR